jgi:Xaa-Pro aminopeptidase
MRAEATATASAVLATASEVLDRRVSTLTEICRAAAVRAILASDPSTVRWIGVERPEGMHVVICEGEAVVVGPLPADIAKLDPRLEAYVPKAAVAQIDALQRALERFDLDGSDRVGFVAAALRFEAAQALKERRWQDLTSLIAAARARKDPDELDRIRAASEHVAVGHRAVRDALQAGVSEIELWCLAQQAIQLANGAPVEAAVDLMARERTALVGQPPTDARIEAGDPVLFDLAPCRGGYWADSCATITCGPSSRRITRRHSAVLGALESGLRAARPGVTAGAVDSAIRSALATARLTCPHHTGHGVGTAAQEPPWLVAGDPTVLEEGMVIALEPGAYTDGFGVRLEHLALIEADGARPLTHHSLSLT